MLKKNQSAETLEMIAVDENFQVSQQPENWFSWKSSSQIWSPVAMTLETSSNN